MAIGAISRLPTIARIAFSSAGSCQNGATSAGTAIHVAKTVLNSRLSSVKCQSRPRDVQAEVGHRQRHRDERGERGRDQAEREEARRQEPSAPGSAGPSTWPATGMLSICE